MALLALLVDNVVVQRFPLGSSVTTIGRTPDNDIEIDDLAVSSKHAQIVSSDAPYLGLKEYRLKDLNSTNHSFVNKQQVCDQQLQSGDLITIGYSQFKFLESEDAEHQETAIILPDN